MSKISDWIREALYYNHCWNAVCRAVGWSAAETMTSLNIFSSELQSLFIAVWTVWYQHTLLTELYNLMHTPRPRALYSGLFLKICIFFRSLYTVGRLVTDPRLWKKVSNLRHYRLESEGKVWSVYIHTVNRIMRFRDLAIWSFPRWPPAAILNLIQPERRSIRRPRKPHPRTKHEGDRLTRCRVTAIWKFCKMCE